MLTINRRTNAFDAALITRVLSVDPLAQLIGSGDIICKTVCASLNLAIPLAWLMGQNTALHMEALLGDRKKTNISAYLSTGI